MRDTINIGNVLTQEIMNVLGNEEISFEQKGQIVCGVLFPEKFKPNDILAKALTLALRKDYVSLTLFCANSKKKELERLKRYYKKNRKRMPAWFPQYYTKITQTCDNVIATLANVSLTSINSNSNSKDNSNSNSNKGIVDSNCIPLNPLGGLDGEIDTDDFFAEKDEEDPPSILEDPELTLREAKEGADEEDAAADEIAEEIEGSYRYKVNGAKLRKSLKSALKKNSAAEVREGYRKWLEVWKGDDFQWAPSRITDWIYDGKYLEEPRRGNTRSAPTVDPDTVCNEAHLEIV